MAQYEVTLRDYWRILRRRKGIVFFTAFLLGFFSFALASIWQPLPLFKATAKVQIKSSQTLTGLYLETIAYNSGDQIETQRAIITSYPVLRRTGEELGLFAGGDTAEVVLDLQDRVVTRQEGYTNIIVISATDPNPHMARQLANAVARVYQEYDFEVKNEQAVRNRRFVEDQRTKAREALAQAEEEVRFYREEAELVSLDAQANVLLTQITQTEQEVSRLEQVRRDINIMVAEIESNGGLSDKTLQGASRSQVGDTFIGLNQQLNNLRLERDGLLVKFTENHPSVQQVQVKIDQLRRTLTEELKQRLQAVLRDVDGSRARLEKMRQDYSQLPSRGLKLARLQREVSLRQEVARVLEEEYQNALIREADKVQDVNMLQWAITPSVPINPHHPLKRAAMGIVLGLVLGVVFAVVAETLDTSIGTIEDVQEYTGAQVVGVIPFIRAEEVIASLRRRDQGDIDEDTLRRKAQLVAYFDPHSSLAESYRTLRTNIEFVTVEKGVKTLMVSSSTSLEGKSTTTANLAMTVAQLGKRTLLVDCDLRKPTVARLFGLDREPGLAEVIVGNYQWREVVRTVTDIVTGGMGMEDLMQAQGISNLHIITSGAIPPNPAELLNSRRMGEFIEEVKQEYDVVLFDTPPVLHVTDAAILGKKVDGTAVVYKAGDVPRTSLRRTINLLRSVEVELLGVVLNGIRADISSEYHDFGYGSYYAYGNEEDMPARTLQERAQEAWSKWRRGGGSAADYEEEVEEEEEADPGEEEGVGRGRRVLSLALLVLAVGGVVWQSGYLQGFAGLAPLVSGSVEGAGTALETEAETAPGGADLGEEVLPAEDAPAPAGEAVEPPSSAADEAVSEDVLAAPAARVADESAPAPSTDAIEPGSPTASPVADESAPAPSRNAVEAALPTGGPSPYALRVAAYAPGSDWALRTLRSLRESGEEAFLVPVQVKGRPMVRLLSGLFGSWEEAHARGRQLQQDRLVEEFAVVHLPYAVELRLFPEVEQARQAIEQLRERGYSTYVQTLSPGSYRLLAGAFESEEEARSFLGELPAETGAARVVRR